MTVIVSGAELYRQRERDTRLPGGVELAPLVEDTSAKTVVSVIASFGKPSASRPSVTALSVTTSRQYMSYPPSAAI